MPGAIISRHKYQIQRSACVPCVGGRIRDVAGDRASRIPIHRMTGHELLGDRSNDHAPIGVHAYRIVRVLCLRSPTHPSAEFPCCTLLEWMTSSMHDKLTVVL